MHARCNGSKRLLSLAVLNSVIVEPVFRQLGLAGVLPEYVVNLQRSKMVGGA